MAKRKTVRPEGLSKKSLRKLLTAKRIEVKNVVQ